MLFFNGANTMEVGVFILVLALMIGLAVAGAIAARKRREAMVALAARLGLRYFAAKDPYLAAQYHFLDRLAQGSNRYAFNILSGQYEGEEVKVFDYHYETYSSDSKGHRQTHHHYFSFFILRLEKAFPELTISREDIFSKVAQAFGFDDIDFESHEFSRKFCVRSKNKKFAYDFCHARMMEYLLANDDLNVEIEGPALAIGFSTTLKPEAVEPNLQRLVQLRRLMPDYLFVT